MTEDTRLTRSHLDAIANMLSNSLPPEPIFNTHSALLAIKDRLVSMIDHGHTPASISTALATCGMYASERQVRRRRVASPPQHDNLEAVG